MIGHSVKGRWNGHSYQVICSLGAGANGKVYLVQEKERKYALKLSSDATGIALEYRLLQQLQKKLQRGVTSPVQGLRLGPFVSDLDDTVTENGGPIYFYAMEYIAGIPVSTYTREKGPTVVRNIALQLLDFLQQLHNMGYAFGDLKADNILADPITGEVRLVDFGGVTRFGEGIRQYTEWYDRAYWQAGSRRADCGYDLFATAMLLAQLLCPDVKQITGGRQGYARIKQLLSSKHLTRAWLPLLEKAWRGDFRHAREMRWAISQLKVPVMQGSLRELSNSFYKKVDQELSREWDWSHWMMVGSAVICMSMILRLLMVK